MNANEMKKMDAIRLNKENEMVLKDNLWDALEDCGFSTTGTVYVDNNIVWDDKYYVEISKRTPAGGDWNEEIWFDGTKRSFVKAVTDSAIYFDVDAEVEDWIPYRGKDGVPSSIAVLLKDAEWKQNELKNLSDALRKL